MTRFSCIRYAEQAERIRPDAFRGLVGRRQRAHGFQPACPAWSSARHRKRVMVPLPVEDPAPVLKELSTLMAALTAAVGRDDEETAGQVRQQLQGAQ